MTKRNDETLERLEREARQGNEKAHNALWRARLRRGWQLRRGLAEGWVYARLIRAFRRLLPDVVLEFEDDPNDALELFFSNTEFVVSNLLAAEFDAATAYELLGVLGAGDYRTLEDRGVPVCRALAAALHADAANVGTKGALEATARDAFERAEVYALHRAGVPRLVVNFHNP